MCKLRIVDVTTLTSAVVLLLAAVASAEVREIIVDPLTSTEHWQVGGRRVNYVLGASSVAPSSEQSRGGAAASLKLTYDFADPARDYLSYYHLGEAIPGHCQQVSFWLYGEARGCRLRLSLEDARGRWFDREVGTVDWTGWRQVTAPVGDGQGWQPLLRRGEELLPLLPPVNLRQIALFRSSPTSVSGAVYIQDLRALSDVVPADLVTAALTTDRAANLFDLGEAPEIEARLANSSTETVTGGLVATPSDFFGPLGDIDLGPISLAPGGTSDRVVQCPAARLGLHQVRLVLRTAERERVWYGRFAVVRPRAASPPDERALFGCCSTLSGFAPEQMPTVLRLNRDAGIRWERIGFDWGAINPARGRWAWEEPTRVEGPVGDAVDLKGQVYEVGPSDALTLSDAVTIAFWAKPDGANGAWQAVLQKWGPGNERNYGAYFARDSGDFCFSASYAGFPDRGWCDVDSGFSGWDGQWRHYAATYSREAKQVVLYVDGQARTTEAWDGGELRANRDALVVGSGYPGGLDEVVLYRRALTADEIATLARKGGPPSEGLVGYWPFDSGAGALRDRSQNGLDLTTPEPYGPRIARTGIENGVKTLGILGFPPEWASTAAKGSARPWVQKPDLAAWAGFVEGTVRRYRDTVQHWEIWNEPNISVFWEPKPSARDYLDVLRVGYEAAKRGNPDCKVLMPGLAGPGEGRWGMDFLDELLGLGGAAYCDAISIHPYRQSTPEDSDLVGDLRHIADLATAHGGRRPIWFTEDCWTTDLPGGSTEERTALMLPRCYALALGSGLTERLIWFRLADPGVDRFYGEDNYGLCYRDLTPKPAYFAHATTALLLEGAEPDGAWDLGPSAMARVFRTPRGRVAVVWSPHGAVPVAIRVGRPSVRVVDLMGNETTASTRDGVLILRAGEAATFLPDLPGDARAEGAILSAADTMAVRGARASITVAVHNPFLRPERSRVSLDASSQVAVAAQRADIEIPAGATRDVTFEAAIRPDADPGWHSIGLTLEFAQERFARDLRVGVRSAPPDPGPVGYWKLDEGTGTVLADASPSGNNGSVEQPKWIDGKRGTALAFDARHIATIPDAASLNLRDEVTIAFWLKLDGDTGGWQFPVAKYQAQGGVRRNYGIYIHKDTHAACFSASFERGGYVHTDVASTPALNDGGWHHVAATCSVFDRRVRLYVDGKLVTDQPFDEGAMLLTSDPLRIGADTSGTIDEVMLFPRALSPDEVAQLAN